MSTEIDLEQVQKHVRRTLKTIGSFPYFQIIKSAKEREQLDKVLKLFLFRYLYYVITGQGDIAYHLFPGSESGISSSHGIPQSLEDAASNVEQLDSSGEPFYMKGRQGESDYLSYNHEGRNCGRKFFPGEPIYRCHECGIDATCVLCVKCFNESDHKNHHVSTVIATTSNTGLCDCGDVDAWKSALKCKSGCCGSDGKNDPNYIKDNDEKHEKMSKEKKTEKFYRSVTMKALVKIVIKEVLDHFIDVFNQNVQPVPVIQKGILEQLRTFTHQGKEDMKRALLDDLAYKNIFEMEHETTFDESTDYHPIHKNYVTVVYNDEYHDYTRATTALMAGQPDEDRINILTSKVDVEGRAVLNCSLSASSLMKGYFAVQNNGLSAVLITWKDYIHQEAGKYLIQWLLDCFRVPDREFQKIIRETLCTLLCEPLDDKTCTFDVSHSTSKHFAKQAGDSEHKYMNLSILAPGILIPNGHHKILSESSNDYISTIVNETKPVFDKYYANSRLQYLMFLENRYWKTLRKDVQDLIVPMLSSSSDHKQIFNEQFLEIFNQLIRNVAYNDREPHLSILKECVVQLLTNPTHVVQLTNSDKFQDVLWSIFDIFKDSCHSIEGFLVWEPNKKSNPSDSIPIALKLGLHTLETIMNKVEDPNILLKPEIFIVLVTIFKIFNNAWRVKRKVGEHILIEDQSYRPYLEHTFSIFSIIDTIGNLMDKKYGDIDQDLLLNALKLLCSLLSINTTNCTKFAGNDDPDDFKVSRDFVSYMHPVHTFFAILSQHSKIQLSHETLEEAEDFFNIVDSSLKSIIFCSQVEIGFWVRNGSHMTFQSASYKHNAFFDIYQNDIYLSQQYFLWNADSSPEIVLRNILHRWELLDWFENKVGYCETIFEDKFGMLIAKYISFLYAILTERKHFQKSIDLERKAYKDMRTYIMYALYMQPLAYSKILDKLPRFTTEDTFLFDKILEEVSDYIEPKTLESNGTYQLKKSLYSEIDPLSLANLDNQFDSSVLVLKKKLAESKMSTSKIIIKPQFVNNENVSDSTFDMGSMFRSRFFAKMIYKLFDESINNQDTSFIYELLHLVHAIFEDYKARIIFKGVPDTFLAIPICNQLFAVANGDQTFDDQIKNKASFLLDNMLDSNKAEVYESLISSFGEDEVKKYILNLEATTLSDTTVKDKKRKLARKRQKKLLAKMSNQQAQFMEEHGDELASNISSGRKEGDTIGGTENLAEDTSCTLCQDTVSDNYQVAVCFETNSPILRKGTIYNQKEFCRKWGICNKEDESPLNFTNQYLQSKWGRGFAKHKGVISSCHHKFHLSCIQQFIKSKKYKHNSFICPLCQTYSNCYLPVADFGFMQTDEPKTEILDRHLNLNSTISGDYNTVMSIENLARVLLQNKNLNMHLDVTKSGDIERFPFHIMIRWANTISALEVSSRHQEDYHKAMFTDCKQRYKTLKDILQVVMLTFKCFPFNNEDIFGPDMMLGDITNFTVSPIQIIVREMFITKKTLRETLVRTINSFSHQILNDFCDNNLQNLKDEYSAKDNSTWELFEAPTDIQELIYPKIKDFCNKNYNKGEIKSICEFISSNVYTSMVKNIIPILRCVLIIVKSITDLETGNDNDDLQINGIDVVEIFDYENMEQYFSKLIRLLTGFECFSQILIEDPETEDLYELAKPKRFDYELVTPIKLLPLESQLNSYLNGSLKKPFHKENNDSQSKNNQDDRVDFKICLTCGTKVYSKGNHHEISSHLATGCEAEYGLFLIPNSSEIFVCMLNPLCSITIAAPYMNRHGETGKLSIKRGEIVELNLKRYNYLNKLWQNNEIPGYISRMMGGRFSNILQVNGGRTIFFQTANGTFPAIFPNVINLNPDNAEVDEFEEPNFQTFPNETAAFQMNNLDDDDQEQPQEAFDFVFQNGAGQPGPELIAQVFQNFQQAFAGNNNVNFNQGQQEQEQELPEEPAIETLETQPQPPNPAPLPFPQRLAELFGRGGLRRLVNNDATNPEDESMDDAGEQESDEHEPLPDTDTNPPW